MGLDVSIRIVEPVTCPHCGELAGYSVKTDCSEIDLCGREWFDLLREIGYTRDNYGDYMMITKEKNEVVMKHLKAQSHYVYAHEVESELLNGNRLWIEADW